jgi:hypothetical protein
MAPELVKFYDEYSDRMTIISLNLTDYPSGNGDLPVSAIPTQFFYKADGTPFVPKEFPLPSSWEFIKDDSDSHILTKHTGYLTYDDMMALYTDIASQQ